MSFMIFYLFKRIKTSRLIKYLGQSTKRKKSSDNESLTKKGVKITGQSLVFDYLTFCKSINIRTIDAIISIGSSSEYNQFLLQEEIYSLLIKKCPEIKYLNICDTYEIVYLPEAKVRLESLCELTFDTLIDEFVEDDDDFDWEQLGDPYTEIFNLLKKHANTLNHFEVSIQYDHDDLIVYDYSFLQYTLLELHNLKILEINSHLFLNNNDFNEKLEMFMS
ncbi:10236_t:CDS:2 [Rhizophagus irregularis]|nr:10236_t:CDS:2 [Rhizophagus irregularis]